MGKREKYMKEYDIKEEDADMFVKDEFLAKLFDGVAEEFDGDTGLIKTASNYITSDIAGLMKIDDTNEKLHKNITAENFAQLMAMTHKNEISSRGAKDILREMYERGGVPSKIAQEKNLFQKSDEDELKKIIEKIISENQKVIYEYKNGKKHHSNF